MQLFYNPEISADDSTVEFDKDESRHIHKVLRLNKGDKIQITNGLGYIFKAKIIDINPKSCVASILENKKIDPLPYSLHMAVAPTKLNDRYEWFLEKATEIGISEITPIVCDHSERKVVKLNRYEKIIQSAVKQSLKAYMPVLHETVDFKTFIGSVKDDFDHKFIAHCDEGDKKTLKSELKAGQDCLILIGPEGDFSPAEIAFAIENDFIPISFGESRLRTETAAIVATHSVSFINLP